MCNTRLQSFSGNNVLLLGQSGSAAPSGTSGNLTLTTPVSLSQLNLLDSDGSGAASLTVKLNFADGTSDTITTTAAMQDWFNGTNSAIVAEGRVVRSSNVLSGNISPNPNMYETDISIPVADQGELIESISFTQTGQAGGTTTTGIFALSGSVVPTAAAVQYSNNVTVTGNSTINVANTLAASMGTLSIGGSTLSVTGTETSGGDYSLAFGATSLTGNPTFNVANSSGGGPGSLVLGSLSDGGTARTITITGGTLTVGSAATSLVQGTVFNIYNGTLNSNATGALGSTATVNVGSAGAFAVGVNQTISALNGSSSSSAVTLGAGAALTVGSTDNLTSFFPRERSPAAARWSKPAPAQRPSAA